MNGKRVYFALLAAVCLSMLALFGGVYMASNALGGQSKSLSKAKAQSMVYDEKQQLLSKQRADINKYQPLAEIAKSIVPQDKDQALTVREIVNIANASGIKLGAINFPSSTLGGGVGGKPIGNTALSQLVPVKGITGVYSLQITVDSDASAPVPYDRFLAFLDTLEHNRRTALVDIISLQPTVNNPSTLTFSLTLSEYIKP